MQAVLDPCGDLSKGMTKEKTQELYLPRPSVLAEHPHTPVLSTLEATFPTLLSPLVPHSFVWDLSRARQPRHFWNTDGRGTLRLERTGKDRLLRQPSLLPRPQHQRKHPI